MFLEISAKFAYAMDLSLKKLGSAHDPSRVLKSGASKAASVGRSLRRARHHNRMSSCVKMLGNG